MVKKCKVLNNDKYSTIFDYDGIVVQIPPIKRDADYINIIKRDGIYIVVSEDYNEVANSVIKKSKKTNKKTTNKEIESKKNEPVVDENEYA